MFGTSNLLSEPLHHIMMEVNELKSREAAIRSAGHLPLGTTADVQATTDIRRRTGDRCDDNGSIDNDVGGQVSTKEVLGPARRGGELRPLYQGLIS